MFNPLSLGAGLPVGPQGLQGGHGEPDAARARPTRPRPTSAGSSATCRLHPPSARSPATGCETSSALARSHRGIANQTTARSTIAAGDPRGGARSKRAQRRTTACGNAAVQHSAPGHRQRGQAAVADPLNSPSEHQRTRPRHPGRRHLDHRSDPSTSTDPQALAELDWIGRRLDQPMRIAWPAPSRPVSRHLVNALVGEDIAPTDATEATRLVTWFRHGAALGDGQPPRRRQVDVPITRASADQIEPDGQLRARRRPMWATSRTSTQWPAAAQRDHHHRHRA